MLYMHISLIVNVHKSSLRTAVRLAHKTNRHTKDMAMAKLVQWNLPVLKTERDRHSIHLLISAGYHPTTGDRCSLEGGFDPYVNLD